MLCICADVYIYIIEKDLLMFFKIVKRIKFYEKFLFNMSHNHVRNFFKMSIVYDVYKTYFDFLGSSKKSKIEFKLSIKIYTVF